jgi:hypothetical protein
MKTSVVGEGDALGKTLRGWGALLTLGDRTRDGKEGCPISWANRDGLHVPRIRLYSTSVFTGDQEHVSLSLDLISIWIASFLSNLMKCWPWT